jgi:hypothetical protein
MVRTRFSIVTADTASWRAMRHPAPQGEDVERIDDGTTSDDPLDGLLELVHTGDTALAQA